MNDLRDYSLIGKESHLAIEKGLADAEWYQSPVPRVKMRELLVRKDWPAIRDTAIWFGLIFGSGLLMYFWWGTWYFIFPFIIYSVLYASSSDSRWHESSHGTAFKTDWMNVVLYEISSFMVFRQSTVWRWSHARHHSDTIIRGRDPEIAVPRPPNVKKIIMSFFGLAGAIPEMRRLLTHAAGKIDPEVATYVPESDHRIVIIKARVYLAIFAIVIALSIIYQTILPLMFIGLPTLFGSWLMPIYGMTQHAGLQENVLDHRLNCRTVNMNFINRFLYWNMNYHVEHHMFPLVPYHALPKLHEQVKGDCPPVYKSILVAFKEIIPAIRKQIKNPWYYVDRRLPENAGQLGDKNNKDQESSSVKIINGMVEVCKVSDLPEGEVVRFDFGQHTYAVYHTKTNNYYATDGICSHGNAHLSDGMVIDEMVECSKHNGRFNLQDGSPKRMPICVGIKTYKVIVKDDAVFLDLDEINAKSEDGKEAVYEVVGNKNVATYIKELELKPKSSKLDYQPGQYIHLSIPPQKISFSKFAIEEPYRKEWEENKLFNLSSENKVHSKRNYSLVTNSSTDKNLKFNVRIALPPNHEVVSAGIGSSYVFNLKSGDEVKLTGPYGDFLIKDSHREMVYLGGGAGMAPIRSHISHLLEILKTNRKVSFWYGARSRNELFYRDYFETLENDHPNFTFELALSEPKETDNWKGKTGFISEVLFKEYLKAHKDPTSIEYYVCGPPAMINSALQLFEELNIPEAHISYDEF